MKPLERFSQLKKQIAKTRRERDKAEGALNEIMRQLKQEFGCKTLEEAETLLKKCQKEERYNERIFKRELRSLEKKWGKFLK